MHNPLLFCLTCKDQGTQRMSRLCKLSAYKEISCKTPRHFTYKEIKYKYALKTALSYITLDAKFQNYSTFSFLHLSLCSIWLSLQKPQILPLYTIFFLWRPFSSPITRISFIGQVLFFKLHTKTYSSRPLYEIYINSLLSRLLSVLIIRYPCSTVCLSGFTKGLAFQGHYMKKGDSAAKDNKNVQQGKVMTKLKKNHS